MSNIVLLMTLVAKKNPGEGLLMDVLGYVLVFVLFVVGAAVISIAKLIIDKFRPIRKTAHEKMSKNIKKEDIERLNKYGLTIDTVCSSAWTLYTVVQKEISNNNLEEVKDYLSNSLYTEYKKQIDEYSNKNQLHITSEIFYKDDVIVGFKEDDDDLCVLMLFSFTCHDYVINKENNSVVSGYKNKSFDCSYWIDVRISKSEDGSSMIIENVKLKEKMLL